jgi:hypothetical protein
MRLSPVLHHLVRSFDLPDFGVPGFDILDGFLVLVVTDTGFLIFSPSVVLDIQDGLVNEFQIPYKEIVLRCGRFTLH